MHTIDPESMLTVHHAEHRQLISPAGTARRAYRQHTVIRRVRAVYVVVLRRAYVRARAAQARSEAHASSATAA
ncbi:hypothetical protein [Demequina globuliformis]|uniref:hypothetical protein n=1 Tax=Demequina globuliformis TaxID=676202 RepID=UPI0007822012|nr:hypothetical protein [Demequina globuliformis]